MADRFPLIVNAVSRKIEEMSSGDRLDLSGNGIVISGDGGSGKYLKSTGTGLLWDTPGDVFLTATQTLTNKTLQNCTVSGSANTFTNIPNSSLINDSITVNGSPVALGGSVTVASENTTYGIAVVDGTGADTKIIRLTGSDSSTNDINIVAGSNMTISRSGDEIELASSFTDTDTVTTIQSDTGGTAQTGAIRFKGTGGATVSQDTVNKIITINSADTNTVTRLRAGTGNVLASGDFTLLAGGATTLTQGTDAGNNPTITVGSTDTVTQIAGGGTASPVTGTVRVLGGTNVTVSQSGQNITVDSTDTNTVTQVAANTETLSAGDFRFVASGATSLTQSSSGGLTTIEISSTDTNTGGLLTASGGIIKDTNDFQLKNNANFVGNTLPKWDSGNGQFTNSLITDDGSLITIGGDLLVQGTQTILNVTTLEVEDNTIELRRGPGLVGADGGVQVNRTSDSSGNISSYNAMQWYESGGYWRSWDGSVENRFVTENEAQTLTNKTLTSPTLTAPTIGAATATSINGLGITSTASADLNVNANKSIEVQRSVLFTTDDNANVVTINFRNGGNVAYRGDTLAAFSSTTSTQLRGLISDTTGLDRLVFQTNPNFITGFTTTSSTFTMINAAATTVTAFGAATTITMGAATGTTTINNDVAIGKDLIVGSEDGNVVTGGDVTFYGNFNSVNQDLKIYGSGLNAITVGRGAAGTSNTAFGVRALANTTSGGNNVGLGFEALEAVNEGSNNVAVGHSALPVVGIGEDNVAVGSSSQLNNLNGSKNVSVGSNSLETVSTGDANVCLGHYAGYALTGNGNVIIGPADDENSTNPTYAPPNLGGDRQLIIASGTETWIQGDSSFRVTVPNDFQVNGDTLIQGSLVVNGTTTTVNSNVMSVDDKNIELAAVTNTTFEADCQDGTTNIISITPTAGLIPGMEVNSQTSGIAVPANTTIVSISENTAVLSNSVSGTGTATFTAAGPSELGANGGGIILRGSPDGTLDKTIIYDHSRSDKYWTFSENLEIALGKKFAIGNQLILDQTTLGSTVLNSSLTSVGILTGLSVDGSITLGGVVTEKVFNSYTTTLTPSSNVLTINVAGANTLLGTPTTDAINEWNFTGVGLSNGQSKTITLILNANTAAIYGDACTVDGTSITNGVEWSGGSPPLATSNTDILSFIIIRDNSGVTRVFGQGNTDFS